jgi:CBS domain-containing protein
MGDAGGGLVPVDARDPFAGCHALVTDRDIALRGVGAGLSPDVAVSEVMTRDVAAADLHWDIDSVAEILMQLLNLGYGPAVSYRTAGWQRTAAYPTTIRNWWRSPRLIPR